LPFAIHKLENGLRVELEGELTIRHAGELAAQIGAALDGGASVAVHTGRLEDADTSVLQLLCSLHKTVHSLSFPQPSAEFLAAADRCGVRRELLGGAQEAQ
jgi:anti-anti-sigma regulatory factor